MNLVIPVNKKIFPASLIIGLIISVLFYDDLIKNKYGIGLTTNIFYLINYISVFIIICLYTLLAFVAYMRILFDKMQL